MSNKTKQYIHIQSAREHNLKNISLKIPRDQFVVITGLSGSGKSSLAFDTIYAEGQRRYVESLSTYARQFLGMMKKPDVDNIEGLSPAISIEQKTRNKNPRSTVGTVTEIYDYLRLLYARIGLQKCYKCNQSIVKQTPQQIVDQILKFPLKSKLLIMAPIVKMKKGTHKDLLENLLKEGFLRVNINDNIYDLTNPIKLEKNQKHTIELVVDRIVLSNKIKERLIDSVELSLKAGNGLVIVKSEKGKHLYNQNLSCMNCDISYETLEPRFFSFNSPIGACTKCNGLGSQMMVDVDLLVPDSNQNLINGCLQPAGEQPQNNRIGRIITELKEEYDISYTTPWKHLPKEFKHRLFYGYKKNQSQKNKVYYKGVIKDLEYRHKNTHSSYIREWIERFMTIQDCSQCNGSRLKPEHLSVYIESYNILDICKLSIKELYNFFNSLKLTKRNTLLAHDIVKEIHTRVKFLNNVGLDYLTLHRNASTLSGGESQRIRLATQIGSRLVGVLYILDEPSIGLHARDNSKLINTLKELKNLGNTVIVVEHDQKTMEAADWIIDLGPGAGVHGGKIVYEGDYKTLLKNKKSLTGKYLSNHKIIKRRLQRRLGNNKSIILHGAKGNNLKKVRLKIPLNKFICVTGVSGSGKSSLINQTLLPCLAKEYYASNIKPLEYSNVEGLLYLDKVIDINQSPIGKTPRSNPATYTGLFTHIRELFANVKESKIRGYKIGRFSFNVKGGRCEACQGMGLVKVEMHFLPDTYIMCDLCKNKRFNRETLQIKYNNKNIADVLSLSIEEAKSFFKSHQVILRKLQTLIDVGLGYIKLGQQATTLSGGESQRIKLSKELSKVYTGRTMYILDEPTTGLHFEDINLLLKVLHSLADKGNTIIVIEHNLDVIKTADWVIDLGPEGGENGGTIIAEGSPEEIIKIKKSYTGKFLKEVL